MSFRSEKHPDADKLNICQVEVGEESPSNYLWCTKRCCRTKSNRCSPGASFPGGIKIKKAKIRGEESNGMICSLQELRC